MVGKSFFLFYIVELYAHYTIFQKKCLESVTQKNAINERNNWKYGENGLMLRFLNETSPSIILCVSSVIYDETHIK